MGAVGGVAILGGNFEAPTFPEDKVVQRSLTAGTQESSAIDAVILDALPLGAPGQLDSHAMLWKGHSNDGSPHTIDWKAFVNVTADDGTGSLWTLQTRIDGAPYTDILTVDDNGLLTVSGATFTMDQLIIDSDNTEAILVRKDGDAGDVFIVDTVNDVVRMGSDATFLTFGASSDARLERFGPRDLGMREPGVGGVGLGAGGENTFRLYARDDVAGSAARFLELTGDGPLCLVKANRAAGGGQFDLNLDVSVGKIAFFNEGVQRWNIQGSVTGDFEFAPFITNRYDLGSATFAVRNLYTHGVIFGTTPASTGTIRLQNTDSIVFRNAGDDGDLEFISSPQSDEFDLFDNANIPLVRFKNVHTTFDGRVTINTGTSTAQLLVGANVLLVDTTNNIVTNSGGTIRGSNSQSYALRDLEAERTVPTVIPNRSELTTGIGGSNSQEISLIVDAIEAVRVDGGQRVRVLNNGVTLDRPARTTDGQTDSHDLLWVGKGFETATPHNIDWKAFVDVTANDGTSSIWTLQTRVDAGGFVDRLTIANSSLTLGLPDDLAAIHLGASGDAQIHRGDAADIWEQRRGLNPQEWRLYDRFVSHADYDRLAVYIGGGPPLKTIEFVAETSNASQGINIDIEALPGGSSDGRITLITGTTQLQVAPSAASINKVFNISTASSSSMTVNGFISNLGFGFAPGIAINIDTFGSNRDSHSIRMIGSGNLGNRATWQTFVEVIDGTANSIWTLQNDLNGGGFNDVLTISNGGLVSLPFSGSALAFGPSPAQSGTIRLQNLDTIVIRNANDNGDHFILESLVSDEYNMFDPLIGRVDHLPAHTRFFKRVSVHVDGTSTSALIVGNSVLLVDTTNNVVTNSGGTIRGANADSYALIDQVASDTAPTLVPRRTSLTTGIGAAAADRLSFINLGVETVKIIDGGRFAINLPEQVSIGSPSFIDNVQVNITGSFIDDYGGGPTETHKLKIQGGQTGDTGRTNRQTSVDVDTFIITQNLSQTINEVGAMFIDAPALTIGTDTVNIGYTLKVNNYPTAGTENYGLLVDGASATANLTALVRFGKSGLQTGIKLLVGGSVGFDDLVANSQMRLTGIYTSDGTVDSATLLHVHTTLLPEDGTTDHITGAFFQGSLRTQVAVESVANISQVRIDEPNIQDNLTGSITNAQSLLITGAPTEGVTNHAFRILSGDVEIGGDLIEFGAGGGGTRITYRGCSTFYLGNLDTPDEMFFGAGSTPTVASAVVSWDASIWKFRTQAANGQFMAVQHVSAVVATTTGSSVTAAGLIPSGSFPVGITTRVITAITGPTGYDVGDGVDVDRWGNSISGALNTTSDIANFTSGAVTTFPTGSDVVITSDGVDFTAGSIRITVHYMRLSAPSS